ncbi:MULTISPECIES: hypothetical protein [unclassified Corynebacterium]|uniref:Rv2732c family membrane protein n=1 Tax=unclassified Corynebacterium TaxID=2624378 RepID=UPI002A90D5BA|nr:hypothetical protein [Corynebacterium sp.]MDY5785990.1 hypothetical protein [Corynebacterium sp.]
MGSDSTAHSATAARELEWQEREASKSMHLGTSRWVLAGCVVAYIVALFLPFAGTASGWQILCATAAADEVQTKLTEFAFVWISFLGLVVLTSLVVATRRFVFAAPAWMACGIALLGSVLAIWLRRTSSTFDAGFHHGPGIYLAIAAVAVAVIAYIPVVFGRSAQQEEIARLRARTDQRDDVAIAQSDATNSRGEANPLLVDDRRARAAERHKRFD